MFIKSNNNIYINVYDLPDKVLKELPVLYGKMYRDHTLREVIFPCACDIDIKQCDGFRILNFEYSRNAYCLAVEKSITYRKAGANLILI